MRLKNNQRLDVSIDSDVHDASFERDVFGYDNRLNEDKSKLFSFFFLLIPLIWFPPLPMICVSKNKKKGPAAALKVSFASI